MADTLFADIDEIPDGDLLKKKDLPGDLELMAEVVGVRNTLKLVKVFQGTDVYFRNFSNLTRKIRNRKIRSEYDRGKKIKYLAREFNLTSRQINSILSEVDD